VAVAVNVVSGGQCVVHDCVARLAPPVAVEAVHHDAVRRTAVQIPKHHVVGGCTAHRLTLEPARVVVVATIQHQEAADLHSPLVHILHTQT